MATETETNSEVDLTENPDRSYRAPKALRKFLRKFPFGPAGEESEESDDSSDK